MSLASGGSSPTPGVGVKRRCSKRVSDDTEARAQCREAVKDRLKSPATAKFSDEKVTGSDPDAVWFVSGAVDSQSGFGALIR